MINKFFKFYIMATLVLVALAVSGISVEAPTVNLPPLFSSTLDLLSEEEANSMTQEEIVEYVNTRDNR